MRAFSVIWPPPPWPGARRSAPARTGAACGFPPATPWSPSPPRSTTSAAVLMLDDFRDLASAIARCRRLLDLDADPEAVVDALTDDPALHPVVARAPGQRIPRTVDEAELAVRAVLGQQVSTKAARTHAGRLVAAYGQPIRDPDGGTDPHLSLDRSTRRDRPGTPGGARSPPTDVEGPGLRPRRGTCRPGRRQRLGKRAHPIAGPAGGRPLDRGGDRHARARRPRRFSRRRPRHEAGRPTVGLAHRPAQPHRAQRSLASLAFLRHPAPVDHTRASGKPLGGRMIRAGDNAERSDEEWRT